MEIQAQDFFQIKGQLLDQQSGEVVIGAVISMTSINDSTINPLNTISSATGEFSIKVKQKGAYKMFTQTVGYLPFEKVVAIIGDKDLGKISLLVDVQLMSEVSTFGKIPPSEQKGDSRSSLLCRE